MKLTEWYTSDIKPVRTGVYPVKNSIGGIRYSRWYRNKWRFMHATVESAENEKSQSFNQAKIWRGIAK